MADVEIGIGKSARRAFGLDEIAIVPSRRTRDANDVDISWQFEAFRFALPFVAVRTRRNCRAKNRRRDRHDRRLVLPRFGRSVDTL